MSPACMSASSTLMSAGSYVATFHDFNLLFYRRCHHCAMSTTEKKRKIGKQGVATKIEHTYFPEYDWNIDRQHDIMLGIGCVFYRRAHVCANMCAHVCANMCAHVCMCVCVHECFYKCNCEILQEV